MRVDLRYAEVVHELWALGHMLQVMEPTVDRLCQQYTSERFAELEQRGWASDEAEVAIAFQDTHDMREYVIPRFMRGPYLVSLTACLESGIKTVISTRAAELQVEVAFRPRRDQSFLSASRRYLEEVLDLVLDEDEARYTRLVDLYQLRHALAHVNGVKELLRQEQWTELLRILEQRGGAAPSRARGALVLTSQYVASAYEDVSNSLRSLVKRAGERR